MDRPIALAALALAECGPGRHVMLARAVDEPVADLPVLAVIGAQPGPTLIVTAGIHGDEYEGPQALWPVAEGLRHDEMHGTLVGLPLCNPWAAAAGERATPASIDGANLARTFPGDPEGSPTQRLAAAIFEHVTRLRPALLLDLHSGGVRYRFHPVVGYRHGLGDEARSEAAARAFGLTALWQLRDHPGTLTAEVARRGVPAIGVEMTGAGGALDADVAADRAGVLNLLRWLGVLRDQPAPEVTGSFHRLVEVASTADGFVVPLREVGQAVAKGEALARVLTVLGETAQIATAPHAGTVWVMRHLRTIRSGEMVCAVAAR